MPHLFGKLPRPCSTSHASRISFAVVIALSWLASVGCVQPARVYPQGQGLALGGGGLGTQATLPLLVQRLDRENAELANALATLEAEADLQEEDLIRTKRERANLALALQAVNSNGSSNGSSNGNSGTAPKTILPARDYDPSSPMVPDMESDRLDTDNVRIRPDRHSNPTEPNSSRWRLTSSPVEVPGLQSSSSPYQVNDPNLTTKRTVPIIPAPGRGLMSVPPPLSNPWFRPKRRSWLTVEPNLSQPSNPPARINPSWVIREANPSHSGPSSNNQ